MISSRLTIFVLRNEFALGTSFVELTDLFELEKKGWKKVSNQLAN